jgi:hypothetical protein
MMLITVLARESPKRVPIMAEWLSTQAVDKFVGKFGDEHQNPRFFRPKFKLIVF